MHGYVLDERYPEIHMHQNCKIKQSTKFLFWLQSSIVKINEIIRYNINQIKQNRLLLNLLDEMFANYHQSKFKSHHKTIIHNIINIVTCNQPIIHSYFMICQLIFFTTQLLIIFFLSFLYITLTFKLYFLVSLYFLPFLPLYSLCTNTHLYLLWILFLLPSLFNNCILYCSNIQCYQSIYNFYLMYLATFYLKVADQHIVNFSNLQNNNKFDLEMRTNRQCSSYDCEAECCDYYGNCPDFYSASPQTNKCWYYYNQPIDCNDVSCPSNLDVNSIIAISVGGAIGLIFIVALILFLCQKCRNKNMVANLETTEKSHENAVVFQNMQSNGQQQCPSTKVQSIIPEEYKGQKAEQSAIGINKSSKPNIMITQRQRSKTVKNGQKKQKAITARNVLFY